MAKKINALFPETRNEECEHGLGFPYTGTIPCTGPRVCPLCGLTFEEAAEEYEKRTAKDSVDGTR